MPEIIELASLNDPVLCGTIFGNSRDVDYYDHDSVRIGRSRGGFGKLFDFELELARRFSEEEGFDSTEIGNTDLGRSAYEAMRDSSLLFLLDPFAFRIPRRAPSVFRVASLGRHLGLLPECSDRQLFIGSFDTTPEIVGFNTKLDINNESVGTRTSRMISTMYEYPPDFQEIAGGVIDLRKQVSGMYTYPRHAPVVIEPDDEGRLWVRWYNLQVPVIWYPSDLTDFFEERLPQWDYDMVVSMRSIPSVWSESWGLADKYSTEELDWQKVGSELRSTSEKLRKRLAQKAKGIITIGRGINKAGVYHRSRLADELERALPEYDFRINRISLSMIQNEMPCWPDEWFYEREFLYLSLGE